MPANPGVSARPSPPATSASHRGTKAPPFLAAGYCVDDDDDFQSPPPARPLKPSNGASSASLRPRKKLRPSSTSRGKENRPVSGCAAPAAAVGDLTQVKEAAGGGICCLLRSGSDGSNASFDEKKKKGLEPGACSAVPEQHAEVKVASSESDSSTLVEPMFPEFNAKCEFGGVGFKEAEEIGLGVHGSASDEGNVDSTEPSLISPAEARKNKVSGFGVHNGKSNLTSIESKLLASNAKYDFGGGDRKESQPPCLGTCSLVSEEREAVMDEDVGTPKVEAREKESDGTDDCKGSYHSNSVESASPTPHMTRCFEADDCFNFEIGTQLNELINLCVEDYVEGHPNSRASPIEETMMHSGRFESVCQVQCPLCGSDISDLTEELQLVHTNNCIDKGRPAKEINSNHEREPCIGENVENRCVVEWLRNLGLSRYEEIFSREEIDWETLQWLTEEDLLGMGITSLGPRKKIIHALGELRKKNDHVDDTEANVSISEKAKKTKLPMSGNKLITEYFWCSSLGEKQTKASTVNKASNLNSPKIPSAKHGPSRSRSGKPKVKDTPLWCCIPGTPFRVDAFRYLRGDCCHWFLTHFHLDHYQGLTRSFCHGKIYCSSITASLVHHKIGVPWDRLHVLPLNKRITVSGVNLTCFDANHCPGSVIILFEPPNGKAVLHTGDFRFSPTMADNPVLRSSQIYTLILDTTYCNPRYDFPSQETVIQFVIEAIQAEAFNPKTLFLIGSYTIGKERVFTEVGRLLKKKIYVGAAKLQILKHLELPHEIMHWLTANEAESHIHVVPMWTLASFKRMKHLSTQYADRFDLIVAFCPTGWAFGKGRKKTPGRRSQQGTVIRYEVPYSEHSSFTELREFVRFISPEHIIPSVNNDGPESADAMLTQLLNDD